MKIQTKLKLHYLWYWLNENVYGRIIHIDTKYAKSDKQRVWILLGADYGNLGDVAITLSQERYLKKTYNEAEVITVPISHTLRAIPKIKKIIGKDDIVTIVGGGNISDLYEDIEFFRQLVIKSFPDNRIISFPQSVYFTPTHKGEMEKRRISKIYGAHKDFLILTRDKVSFQRMKRILPNSNVKLAPDIVMSDDCRKDAIREKKVLVCLRKDKESADLDSSDLARLISNFGERGFEIVYRDTQIEDRLVRRDGGKHHLDNLIKEIGNSSLLITDRLHGMIFAFITGTPAIVLDNSTGKVSATYEWIKDCGFIILKEGKINLDRLIINDNFNKVNYRINEVLFDSISKGYER